MAYDWRNDPMLQNGGISPSGYSQIEEIAQLRAENERLEFFVGTILAVIHRDGGQYQKQHGLIKASDDAIAIIHQLRHQADLLAVAVKETI